MSETNEDLMRGFLKLWETRDADGMANHFAENGVYDNVPDKKPMVGREAIRQWLEMVFQHVDRIDVEILSMASKGEWVLAERRDDHVAGDKHMVVPVMNATRIVDGKFVDFRDYYCRDTCRELGLM